jgi:hypothetical protein
VDFPCTDQIIEAAQDFVERRGAVGHVGPQQVDAVGLEALEAFLYRADEILAVVAGAGDAVGGGEPSVYLVARTK